MDDDSLKRKKRSSWGNKDYNQRNYGKEFGSRGSESQGNFPSCRRILTFEILVKYLLLQLHFFHFVNYYYIKQGNCKKRNDMRPTNCETPRKTQGTSMGLTTGMMVKITGMTTMIK